MKLIEIMFIEIPGLIDMRQQSILTLGKVGPGR